MNNIYLYILVAGLVSTLIRVIPITLIKGKIQNEFVQSFLYYLPYVTLAVMTFPAIIEATTHLLAGVLALLAGSVVAYKKSNLFVVSVVCCVVVFVTEMLYTVL